MAFFQSAVGTLQTLVIALGAGLGIWGAINLMEGYGKLREDLQKAIAKRDEAEKKVKQLQAKLKEEENHQIVSDVASYNLSPEQLAQFLQLAGSGKLQELLNGQVKMPEPVTMNHAGDKPAEDEENLFDENEEDDQDEDN